MFQSHNGTDTLPSKGRGKETADKRPPASPEGKEKGGAKAGDGGEAPPVDDLLEKYFRSNGNVSGGDAEDAVVRELLREYYKVKKAQNVQKTTPANTTKGGGAKAAPGGDGHADARAMEEMEAALVGMMKGLHAVLVEHKKLLQKEEKRKDKKRERAVVNGGAKKLACVEQETEEAIVLTGGDVVKKGIVHSLIKRTEEGMQHEREKKVLGSGGLKLAATVATGNQVPVKERPQTARAHVTEHKAEVPTPSANKDAKDERLPRTVSEEDRVLKEEEAKIERALGKLEANGDAKPASEDKKGNAVKFKGLKLSSEKLEEDWKSMYAIDALISPRRNEERVKSAGSVLVGSELYLNARIDFGATESDAGKAATIGGEKVETELKQKRDEEKSTEKARRRHSKESKGEEKQGSKKKAKGVAASQDSGTAVKKKKDAPPPPNAAGEEEKKVGLMKAFSMRRRSKTANKRGETVKPYSTKDKPSPVKEALEKEKRERIPGSPIKKEWLDMGAGESSAPAMDLETAQFRDRPGSPKPDSEGHKKLMRSVSDSRLQEMDKIATPPPETAKAKVKGKSLDKEKPAKVKANKKASRHNQREANKEKEKKRKSYQNEANNRWESGNDAPSKEVVAAMQRDAEFYHFNVYFTAKKYEDALRMQAEMQRLLQDHEKRHKECVGGVWVTAPMMLAGKKGDSALHFG